MDEDKALDMNRAVMLFDLELLNDDDITILTVGGSLSANKYFKLNDTEKLLNNTLDMQVQCIFKDIKGYKNSKWISDDDVWKEFKLDNFYSISSG